MAFGADGSLSPITNASPILSRSCFFRDEETVERVANIGRSAGRFIPAFLFAFRKGKRQ